MRGNPHKGEVRFEAGDKEYCLRLGINAICSLEAELNIDIGKIGQKLTKERGIRLMRTVFRVLCTPPMSDEQAGDLIDELGIAYTSELMAEAFNRAFDRDQSSVPSRVAAARPAGTATLLNG